MKFYEAIATIQAAPDVVWSILTDGPGYPKWESGIDGVDGSIADGERITVHSEVNPGRTFPVRIHLSEDKGTMTWTGGMPLGLFRGIRTFTLMPTDQGGTQFRMREEYSGLLLSLIWRTIPDLGPSFEKFAVGLKATAEQAIRGV
jgi:hypothetical protein